MATIELSAKEVEFLTMELQSYVTDVRMEVANTDSASVRKDLQNDEASANAILAKLRLSAGSRS